MLQKSDPHVRLAAAAALAARADQHARKALGIVRRHQDAQVRVFAAALMDPPGAFRGGERGGRHRHRPWPLPVAALWQRESIGDRLVARPGARRARQHQGAAARPLVGLRGVEGNLAEAATR
jgi:hypothetical protein